MGGTPTVTQNELVARRDAAAVYADFARAQDAVYVCFRDTFTNTYQEIIDALLGGVGRNREHSGSKT